MFIVIHLILGLLIGSYFDSKLLIIIVALLSHFLLDYFPHWDGWFDKEYFERTGIAYLTKKDLYIVTIDFILTILVFIAFWHYLKYAIIDYSRVNIVLGAFMSILPDLVKIGYVTELRHSKYYDKFLKFHSKIQKRSDEVDWRIGIIIQVLFMIAILLVIINMLYF